MTSWDCERTSESVGCQSANQAGNEERRLSWTNVDAVPAIDLAQWSQDEWYECDHEQKLDSDEGEGGGQSAGSAAVLKATDCLNRSGTLTAAFPTVHPSLDTPRI